MKALVVCYSLDGTTRQVGRELAEALGADFDEILESRPREGYVGYLRAVVESLAKGLPALRPGRDPSDYDLVVLGTPVWGGAMSSPMRAYLFRHASRLPVRLGFFCTMNGWGGELTLAEMRGFCGADDAPGMILRWRDVERNRHRPDVRDFADRLRRLGPAPMQQVATGHRPSA